MHLEGHLAHDVAARQVVMFGAFVGPGLFITRAALARASGIPESTLRIYAEGAAIPFHAVLTLRRFLPGEAINMLAEPGAARLVDLEHEATNWDSIAAEAAGLTFEICEARKDGQIDHVEGASLRRRARGLAAGLAEVVATD